MKDDDEQAFDPKLQFSTAVVQEILREVASQNDEAVKRQQDDTPQESKSYIAPVLKWSDIQICPQIIAAPSFGVPDDKDSPVPLVQGQAVGVLVYFKSLFMMFVHEVVYIQAFCPSG